MTSFTCQDLPCLRDVVPVYYYKVESNGKSKISVITYDTTIYTFLPDKEEIHTISTSYLGGGINYLILTKTGLIYSYRQSQSSLDDFSLRLVPYMDPITTIVEETRQEGYSHIILTVKKELLLYDGKSLVHFSTPCVFDKLCLVGSVAVGITLSGDYYDPIDEEIDNLETPIIRIILVDFNLVYLTSQGRLFLKHESGEKQTDVIEIPDNLVIVDIAQERDDSGFYCLSSEGKVYSVILGKKWKLIEKGETVIDLSYNRVHTLIHCESRFHYLY